MNRPVLSFSHRERCAAAALAPGPVGVDLECRETIARRHVRYFARRGELSAWRGTDPTVLWVLKEAAWKALGLADNVPFKALRLEFGKSGRLIAVRHARARYAARARIAYPWPGYVLAVVRLGRRT